MVTDSNDQPANGHSFRNSAHRLARWGRPLALLAAGLFCGSLCFPVVAALSQNTASFPKWWGMLDVGLAFVLAILALGMGALTQGKSDEQITQTTYRLYRLLIHLLLAMLVVFLVFGDRIVWENGLPGLVWRTWLLLYSLPAWLTAWRR